MMGVLHILAANAGLVLACMLALWLLSIVLGDVSFIDSFWALGFVLIAANTCRLSGGAVTRKTVLVATTAFWGLRLASHLWRRWRRHGPDPRYVALLSRPSGNVHLFTLRYVFLLQGALMWLVSLPIQLGQSSAEPARLGALGILGLVVSVGGIAIESLADAQLTRFKADPANAGRVLDRGLWRYTRHPNYFGDACVWWGLFLVSFTGGITVFGVIGPLVMTILLRKWSGVPLLERRLKRTRPEYAAYIDRTSPFVPMPPRRPSPS
jgi:steroid 5-alpha reductase family enzyme